MSCRSTSAPCGVALRVAALVLALAAIVSLCLAHASTGRAATVSCPGTFQVEHDDRIGSLSLPAGAYNIRATGVSCAASSQLFVQFLNDWDGRLPGSWRTTVRGVGRGTFTGPGGQAFVVQRGGGGADGGGSLVCSQRFVLTQNDRIGPLVIKNGRYIIDRLGPLSPSCAQDASLLQGFLMDFDGVLPNGWTLLPNDATFVRGSVSYGFRVEPDPDPDVARLTFAITVAGRGFDARISTEYANPLPESACVYCGNCIAVCPTGALMFSSEHELREAAAWDESRQSRTETICPYCGVGCNLTLHVQDNQIVKVSSPDDHDITRGNLCIKGRFGFQHVSPKPDSTDTA